MAVSHFKPVEKLSKEYVCDRLIARIAGSEPAEDMDFHLWCLLCDV